MQKLKLVILSLTIATSSSFACTDIFYKYKDQCLVANNFDWYNNNTDVLINPIGVTKYSKYIPKGKKALSWKSKYGSVTFVMTYDNGKPADNVVEGGINQKGLVVSLLALSEAKFPNASNNKPNINNTYLLQYWLDNYSSVSTAVNSPSFLS